MAYKRKKPILDIILEANESLAWLRQTKSEVCTSKGFISAVLAAIGDPLQSLRYDCRKHNNSGYKNCCCLTVFCNKGIRAICQLQDKLQAMCHVAKQIVTRFQSQAIALHVQSWNGTHACRLQLRCSAELLR